MWLVDASVLLAAEDSDDEHHADATLLLTGEEPLATLDLAYYEVGNVAVRAWRDRPAAERLRERVAAIAGDGGLCRADPTLLDAAITIADEHGISVHDAAYVAAAHRFEYRLVSCDLRDLVSRELAILPRYVRATDRGRP